MTRDGRRLFGTLAAAVILIALVLTLTVARPSRTAPAPRHTDWLLDPAPFKAEIKNAASGELILGNGLIERTFRLEPNAATVGFQNLMTGEAVLRAVRPEALLVLDGKPYAVGGLAGQVEQAYLLPEGIDALTADAGAFRFRGFETGRIEKRLSWKRVRYAPAAPWPPTGVRLTLRFDPPEGAPAGLSVAVHYELYDGIPLLSKGLTVENTGERPVLIDSFTNEILAVVEPEATVGTPTVWERPSLHVESDYSFGGGTAKTADHTTFWVKDPLFTSQINWLYETPCVLESRPTLGPAMTIGPGERFEGFRTFELVFDSSDRERKGLSLRRMYRTLAPWSRRIPSSCTSSPPTRTRCAAPSTSARKPGSRCSS